MQFVIVVFPDHTHYHFLTCVKARKQQPQKQAKYLFPSMMIAKLVRVHETVPQNKIIIINTLTHAIELEQTITEPSF